jgi:hypothetical protein
VSAWTPVDSGHALQSAECVTKYCSCTTLAHVLPLAPCLVNIKRNDRERAVPCCADTGVNAAEPDSSGRFASAVEPWVAAHSQGQHSKGGKTCRKEQVSAVHGQHAHAPASASAQQHSQLTTILDTERHAAHEKIHEDSRDQNGAHSLVVCISWVYRTVAGTSGTDGNLRGFVHERVTHHYTLFKHRSSLALSLHCRCTASPQDYILRCRFRAKVDAYTREDQNAH